MLNEAIMEDPAITAGANSEADDIDDSLPLTTEDVARIISVFKNELTQWKDDTATCYGTIEAKLRRERAMGLLLITLKDAGLLDQGGRPPKTKTNSVTTSVSLADLGITATQSSRWQLGAQLPDMDFERWIADTKVAGQELTSVGLRRLASDYVKLRDGVAPPVEFETLEDVDDGMRACEACLGLGRVRR